MSSVPDQRDGSLTKASRRSRLRLVLRIGISSLGAAFLLGALALAIWGEGFIARAIVTAPNAGRSFRAEDDPSRDEVRKAGVDDQLRVDLGPPHAVSLSAWVIEPKAPPPATVLVLHGIRSDKFWFVGLGQRIAAQGFRAVIPDLRGHG